MMKINVSWRKGQSVRMLMGRCCPECGAFILGTSRTRHRRVRERVCKACHTTQFNTSDDAEGKAYIVGVPMPEDLRA